MLAHGDGDGNRKEFLYISLSQCKTSEKMECTSRWRAFSILFLIWLISGEAPNANNGYSVNEVSTPHTFSAAAMVTSQTCLLSCFSTCACILVLKHTLQLGMLNTSPRKKENMKTGNDSDFCTIWFLTWRTESISLV